jgi:hypothetical protein
MISIDAVRSAAFSDMPWTRLDELVRAEINVGRSVKEIAEEWARMANEVWEAPGLSEDGKDAFGDTLDALTGNTHSDSCYKDPPKTTLPPDGSLAPMPDIRHFHPVATD